ncbi:hypothetical protein M3147_08930 [Agromyces mediolanus]|uniref:hypothetical protein n=1 Tax=Agromyces mediolanus TaxID=41986 RepID=UPI00203EDD03|nr:hypothetical protein [Agromyces mediolanus]MCM3657372.1 hypothetical protein [Agromyces mediolanus]
MRGLLARWWARPAVRRRAAVVVAGAGTVLAVLGVFTGRWGVVVVAIVLLGLAAALGPARIRR